MYDCQKTYIRRFLQLWYNLSQMSFPVAVRKMPQRMRALVLLLRYGGMRKGDTVSLSGERIEENRLLLYTQKTGVPGNNVLPDFVLKVLDGQ